jgi:hypothetical protein
LCILLIGKFLMQYSYKTCVKCFQLYVCVWFSCTRSLNCFMKYRMEINTLIISY